MVEIGSFEFHNTMFETEGSKFEKKKLAITEKMRECVPCFMFSGIHFNKDIYAKDIGVQVRLFSEIVTGHVCAVLSISTLLILSLMK